MVHHFIFLFVFFLLVLVQSHKVSQKKSSLDWWLQSSKILLYQYGPATINGMHWIFYIEVPMCMFHRINDFNIRILIVASTP